MAYRREIRHCNVAHGQPDEPTYCVNPAQCSQCSSKTTGSTQPERDADVRSERPVFFTLHQRSAHDPSNWLSQIIFHGSHSHYNPFRATGARRATTIRLRSRNNVWFRNRMRGWDPTGPKRATPRRSRCAPITPTSSWRKCAREDGYHTALSATFSGTGDNFPVAPSITSSPPQCSKVRNYNKVNDAVGRGGPQWADDSGQLSVFVETGWFGHLPWPPIDLANFSQSNNFRTFRRISGRKRRGRAPPAARPGTIHRPSRITP